MATVVIPASTIVTDDITGKELASTDKPIKVKITVDGGKAFELDIADAAKTRLVNFLSNPTDETRAAFGDILPRTRVTGNSKSGESETGKAREWLRGLSISDRTAISGYDPKMVEAGTRGKLPEAIMDAYRAANVTPETPADNKTEENKSADKAA